MKNNMQQKSNNQVFLSSLLILVIQILGASVWSVSAQSTPPPNSEQIGLTRMFTLRQGIIINAGVFMFTIDSDHDGMPDDIERQNGTDPFNPNDADGDLDGDGVSNGDEVGAGTNPNSNDSDGDGVSDAEEIANGFDPLDPQSTPSQENRLVSLQITPSRFGISVNLNLGQTPFQLRVTGTTQNGTTVELTDNPTISYRSLNENIAFVQNGLVFGIRNGNTVIEVSNGTLSAQVPVTVTLFSPTVLTSLAIPGGNATDVEVAGDLAYIAAGLEGLQIVNISNRSNPFIVGALDTTGFANDVRVVGNLAYIADGTDGLKIINVSNPQSPVLVGVLDTIGNAQDLVVVGNRVYLADASGGLQIIDSSNPANPFIIHTIATPQSVSKVAVSGNYAVVTSSPDQIVANLVEQPLLLIIDINRPQPAIVGQTEISFSQDLAVRGNLAYVVNVGGQVFDFSNPTSPFLKLALPFGRSLFAGSIELQGNLAFVGTNTVNPISIIDIENPTTPLFRGEVNFFPLQVSFSERRGIATDANFTYLAGSSLYISQYQIPSSETGDIAPNVSLTSPQNGQTLIGGNRINLEATATDNVYVAGVRFSVNGVVVGNDMFPPYTLDYQVPNNVSSLTITATAFDLVGNQSITQPVTVNVLKAPDMPDPDETE